VVPKKVVKKKVPYVERVNPLKPDSKGNGFGIREFVEISYRADIMTNSKTSGNEDGDFKFNMINETDDELTLWWFDQDGKSIEINWVYPKESTVIDSSTGHAWAICKDSNVCLARVCIRQHTRNDTTVDLKLTNDTGEFRVNCFSHDEWQADVNAAAAAVEAVKPQNNPISHENPEF